MPVILYSVAFFSFRNLVKSFNNNDAIIITIESKFYDLKKNNHILIILTKLFSPTRTKV